MRPRSAASLLPVESLRQNPQAHNFVHCESLSGWFLTDEQRRTLAVALLPEIAAADELGLDFFEPQTAASGMRRRRHGEDRRSGWDRPEALRAASHTRAFFTGAMDGALPSPSLLAPQKCAAARSPREQPDI